MQGVKVLIRTEFVPDEQAKGEKKGKLSFEITRE